MYTSYNDMIIIMNDNQTKREAGTGDIVEAVRHVRILLLELLPMEFRWPPQKMLAIFLGPNKRGKWGRAPIFLSC